MKHIIKLLLLVILITSCNNHSKESVCEVTALSKLEKADYSTKKGLKTDEVIKKKIIKDGKLSIEVTDLTKSKNDIDTLVRAVGGYYDSESLNNTDNESAYELKIRIPIEKFELFISKIDKGEGKVLTKDINARDVTDEFIDLETRLANKRNYLVRYQELLKKAKSVKEILEIQEKVRALEEEIESKTGQLKYLNDLVDYSTLELKIIQKKDYKFIPEQRVKFSEKLKQSVSQGWYGFVDFLLLILSNWVFIFFTVLLIYILFKYRKRIKMKKQKK